jgi:hypothetical protein
MGALLGPAGPDLAHGLGAFQGLELGLLIDAEDDRPLGWVQVRPTTSWTLAASWGSVENLKVAARQGCTPYSRQMRAMVSRRTPSSRASSRID